MAYYRRRNFRSSKSRGRRSNQRSNVWGRLLQNAIPGTPDGNHPMDLLPDGVVDRGAVTGSTVVRTHFDVQLVGGSKASAAGLVAIGLAVMERVSDISLIPDPITWPNSVDWMYWRVMPIARFYGETLTSGSPAVITENVYTEVFDVKAQRRIVAPNQTLTLCVQLQGTAYNPAMAVNVSSSVLLKLG